MLGGICCFCLFLGWMSVWSVDYMVLGAKPIRYAFVFASFLTCTFLFQRSHSSCTPFIHVYVLSVLPFFSSSALPSCISMEVSCVG